MMKKKHGSFADLNKALYLHHIFINRNFFISNAAATNFLVPSFKKLILRMTRIVEAVISVRDGYIDKKKSMIL